MAKVSLRVYNREIESLIDQGRLDEAIAHCRHILETFSKHLETYRLLGKGYLEAKRYDEAVDVFSRLLMAVPDDFVSHVGMSIIRDDQNRLDDAIWHMERAFEAQPSNAAIQGELRRLFGRRDGVEPARIRMTRGALAHMYIQGELYTQAISEIKAVLAHDAERDDMKALLARAYFHSGQKADASDICSQLLERYPYAFEANRIMLELLQGSASDESTRVYRHRVNELDPYSAFAQGSTFRSSEVPDAAVNLERLDYKGPEAGQEVDWRTAGISLGPGDVAREPEWLNQDLEAAPAEEAAPPVPQESQIPDFLRQAGWTESTGLVEEPAAFEPEAAEEGEAELSPGDLPDWLKSMAPAESEPPPAAAPAAENPDWLKDLQAEASFAPQADIPDWLQDMESTESEAGPSTTEGPLPDWLQPVAVPPAPAAEPPVQAVPDVSEAEAEPATPMTEPAAEEPVVEPPEIRPAEAAASVDTLGTSTSEQDAAMAWLESLAAKHGAKSEELVTPPDLRSDEPPEWVQKAQALAGVEPAGGEPSPAIPEEPGFGEPEPQEPQFVEPATDETGVWLRELARQEETGREQEEGLLAVESTEAVSTESASDLADWLSKLDASSEKTEESEPGAVMEAEAPAETSDLPEWLRNLEPSATGAEQPPAEAVPGPEEAPAEAAGLPAWLRGLEEEEKVPPSESAGDELPAWLRREAELPAQPERTAPTDWRPLESEAEEEEPFETQPVSVPGGGDEEVPAEVEAAAELEAEEQPYETQPVSVEREAEEAPLETQAAAAPQTELEAELAAAPEPATGEAPVEEAVSAPEPEVEEDLFEAQVISVPEPVIEEEPFQPQAESELEQEVRLETEAETPVETHVELPAPEPSALEAAAAEEPVPVAPETSAAAPLAIAHSELSRGDIPAALTHYGKLIRRGKQLEEIIRDLREALYRYPVEVTMWQTLGDAYMRGNRLQEALDAYTKAEELLR